MPIPQAMESETKTVSSTQVYIVGSSESQRQRLAKIAGDAGLSVAGHARHPAEASSALTTLCPGLVLIDQPTGLHDAVRWVKEVAAHGQQTSVAVFSPYGDAMLAERILRARCQRIPSQNRPRPQPG